MSTPLSFLHVAIGRSKLTKDEYRETLELFIMSESIWNSRYISNIQMSEAETFIAAKLAAGNFRWAGTLFYLRTGKRMAEKSANNILEFKSIPDIYFLKEYRGVEPKLQ